MNSLRTDYTYDFFLLETTPKKSDTSEMSSLRSRLAACLKNYVNSSPTESRMDTYNRICQMEDIRTKLQEEEQKVKTPILSSKEVSSKGEDKRVSILESQPVPLQDFVREMNDFDDSDISSLE